MHCSCLYDAYVTYAYDMHIFLQDRYGANNSHIHILSLFSSTTSNQINKQALSNMRMGPQTN